MSVFMVHIKAPENDITKVLLTRPTLNEKEIKIANQDLTLCVI